MLFESYADIRDWKIDIIKSPDMGSDQILNKQAIGYFLYKLGPYVEISMKKFVADYITIRGKTTFSYNQLTKHITNIGQETKDSIDKMFTLTNTLI